MRPKKRFSSYLPPKKRLSSQENEKLEDCILVDESSNFFRKLKKSAVTSNLCIFFKFSFAYRTIVLGRKVVFVFYLFIPLLRKFINFPRVQSDVDRITTRKID